MIVEAQTYNFNTKAEELLTIFLDSGSQHSFIRKETAKSLEHGDTTARWAEITQNFIGFTGTVPKYIANNSEDASKKVFAAAAYLVCRPPQQKPFSHLIYAKAKVAAPGKTTIPRLELKASVIAAKLVRFLRKELPIRINSVHLLSDLQIALYWIHSKKQLKTVVHHRVQNIHGVKDELEAAKIPCRFHYVSTDQKIVPPEA
ncbi:unnamed protein product [Heligmosomoides polygyrus]|uniref:DUF1758 domain-containing protein n=1 Tax=Heligmosomoides polygyrus TaxID=6339 RepID=A0A183FWR2_HELPZ|nr:unnamed protein product [Heligmosomoides polygyrus]